MNSILKYMRYFLAFLLLALFANTTVQASASIRSTSVDLHLDGTIKKIKGDSNLKTCNKGDKFLLGTKDKSSTGQVISLILTVDEVLNDSYRLPMDGVIINPKKKQNLSAPRPCIGIKKVGDDQKLEFTLRRIYDKNKPSKGTEAYIGISLQAVEKNNNDINVTLDGVHFLVHDLDKSLTNTSTDDFFYNGKPQNLKGSLLKTTNVAGKEEGHGYEWKVKGKKGLCDDSDPRERITCEAGGYIINSGKVEFRMQNDNSFGEYKPNKKKQSVTNTFLTAYRLFQISFTEGNIPSKGIDHGDAPESYGDASSNIGSAGTYSLGDSSLTDGEGAQYSKSADADDKNNDDEDGVSIDGKTIDGSTFTLTKGYKYKFNITSNANGYLNAWMDHNKNGAFDGGERFISRKTDANNSTNRIDVTIPQTATVGTTYMRFRYVDNNFTNPIKRSPGFGEVEDYRVIIKESGGVRGTVYNDKNANGTQDPGENGIENVVVRVVAANGEKQNMKTGTNGEYRFTGIALGLATVTIDKNSTALEHSKGTGDKMPRKVTVEAQKDSIVNKGYQFQANLVTTKTVNNETPRVGETIKYTLTVTNKGPASTTGVYLEDKLPSGVTLQNANTATGTYDESTGTWSIGTLTNGQTATLELVASVDASSGNKEITNTTTAAKSPNTGDSTGVGDKLSATIRVGAVPKLKMSDANVTEGGKLRFKVTFAQTSNIVTEIKFNTVDGTGSAGATSPDDYTPLVNHVEKIPKNTKEWIVEVNTKDDTKVEDTEKLTINGEVIQGQTKNKNISAKGTIYDNDDPVVVKHITDDTVDEGEVLSHEVTMSTSASTVKTYNFSFENIDTNASDYSFEGCVENGDVTCDINDGTISVNPGVTTFTIKVKSKADTVYEGEEQYTVKVGDKEATGRIKDRTEPKIASISDANATEGNVLTHTVTMSGASASDGEFSFEIKDIETMIGDDYSTDYNFTNKVKYKETHIIVPAQVTTFDVKVTSKTDDISEGRERYRIKIGDKEDKKTAIGTIIDTGVPTVSITNPEVTEGGDLVFDVNLSMKSTKAIYVVFSAQKSSTAKTGSDYESFSAVNWVKIPADTLGAKFTIHTKDDDIKETPKEYINLVGNIWWGETTNKLVTAKGTIIDDDNDVSVDSIENVTVYEGQVLKHKVIMEGISDIDETYTFKIEDITTYKGDANITPDYNITPTFSQKVKLQGDKIVVPADTEEFTVYIKSYDDDRYEAEPESYKISIGGKEANGTIKEHTKPSVLRDDKVSRFLAKNGTEGVDIDILANDDSNINISTISLSSSAPNTKAIDTDGDGDIDKLVVPGEGTWTIDDKGVLNFTYSDLHYEHEYSPITYKTKDNKYQLEPATVVLTSLDIYDT